DREHRRLTSDEATLVGRASLRGDQAGAQALMTGSGMGRTRFAQNDLARLSYEVDGPEDGPPVIFLHATLGDHRTIGDLQGELAPEYRLILPDARGHGASAALQS